MLFRRSTLSSKVSSFAACALLAVSTQSFDKVFAQDKNAAALPKNAALTDAPVGSKSREDLLRRLSKAYDTHSDSEYLSLFKASVVQKLHLQIQFDRDSKFIARNFRYVTVSQEKARLSTQPAVTIAPDKKAQGEKAGSEKAKTKSLPIVAYIDFDLKTAPNAPPVVIGLPVVQAKELYYLMAL